MFDLQGATALVTGATGGLGGAIARALRAQGARVAVSGTRRDALDALAAELGADCPVLPCDLGDRAQVEALASQAEAALGSIDILVNNAGITRDGLAVRMKDEDWDRVLHVDLTSGFTLARAALKGMMKRRHGRIIGITSVVGVTGNAGQANYAAAKAGMIGMSKAIAAEVATRGITVNCIAPGFIESPMTDALNDKQRAAILGTVPAGRLGLGAEIAAATVYLASREAAYVTGQTLHVNGGMAMI
ncbi:3-oxoacyl-[acyl-carrier-protein] reductase [Lichenibacterium minor]|uniref:3-oxoacyl-[acyl-carrier-protein] reductase n=1 Tax=Lichenibacterium minor TaxID=2316528 RepID=A0A4Q2U8E7_9HYPH|nr:3-oxoacyl-[acyl-carrier-protein] reductase [Lichenibacterium minor]RYC33009.1 3-oxoacyl-[acyl-carrier-protein] reductase [Lichenibacterium minor]